MICIWFSWCHCHTIISCFSKIQNGSSFWYRPTQVVLEKRPLNVCVCMCVLSKQLNVCVHIVHMCVGNCHTIQCYKLFICCKKILVQNSNVGIKLLKQFDVTLIRRHSVIPRTHTRLWGCSQSKEVPTVVAPCTRRNQMHQCEWCAQCYLSA